MPTLTGDSGSTPWTSWRDPTLVLFTYPSTSMQPVSQRCIQTVVSTGQDKQKLEQSRSPTSPDVMLITWACAALALIQDNSTARHVYIPRVRLCSDGVNDKLPPQQPPASASNGAGTATMLDSRHGDKRIVLRCLWLLVHAGFCLILFAQLFCVVCFWRKSNRPCNQDSCTDFTIISTTYVSTIHKLIVIVRLKHVVICLFQVTF